MKILEEHVNNQNINFTFWSGYDEKIIAAHPVDGSKGMMIVFIETDTLKEMIKDEAIKKIEDLNSSYVGFWEVPTGYHNWKPLLQKFKTKYNQPFKGLFGVKGGD